MRINIRKLLLTMIFITLITTISTAQKNRCKRAGGPPKALSRGIACLVSQDWVEDDLQELGLQAGSMAKVRFKTGHISGTSPNTSNITNVLFLSTNGLRGWLLFFRKQPNGTVVAIRNGYRVRRIKEGWIAGEGNGGSATYKAIAAYVGELSRLPILSLTLQPSSEGCHVE